MRDIEIQTCATWNGSGESRHRWFCPKCGEHGPPEIDGAVCRYQLGEHECYDAKAVV